MKRRHGSNRTGSVTHPRRLSARSLRLILVSLGLITLAAGIVFVPNRLFGASAAQRGAAGGDESSAGAQTLTNEKFARLASQTKLFGASNSLAFLLPSSAQNIKASGDGLWQKVNEKSIIGPAERLIIPRAYQTVRLNKDALTRLLARAPLEFTEAARNSQVTMTLPMPDGTFSKFRVEESPIMEPALAARFPEIKTYKGQGIDDPTATIRFDVTPTGFHAMIISVDGTTYVDPYAKGDTTNYLSFYKRDAPNDAKNFTCFTSDANDQTIDEIVPAEPEVTAGPTLRTYRLALAATGEYTNIFRQVGDTDAQAKDHALAAMVTTMNRVDGVYEREVAVRMIMVANELSIIYTNPATDPYTNDDGGTMLSENQSNLTSVIGSANYDIGHVFSTGGGGIAQVGVPCRSTSKAMGVTGLPNPVGDAFSIDYVAHEMGHQYGAQHPFNGTTSNCGGGNRSNTSAYEPGSGSTIMAYAGICAAQDLQLHSDDYFQVKSLESIVTYITGTNGNSCPAKTNTGNTAPTVNAGPDYNIPKGTPFTLTATASDVDGDALTYCWEEYDRSSASPPDTDSDGLPRPILRSYSPTTGSSRTFPSLQYILNNANVPPSTYDCGRATTPCETGEILPSITRTMTFQVTARDNRAGGSGINTDTALVIVSALSGPFAVTQPNGAVSWASGSTQTVAWNVANTTAAPVSCANVKISLSTDGGNNFSTVLASTPNDGTETITVPDTPSTTARIKVEAVGNIFFDISDANFNITDAVLPPYHAPYNFDNDNLSNVSTWRGSDGLWSSLSADGSQTQTFFWGAEGLGDKIVPGDYDGDGKTDFAVYRSSTGVWYISKSSGGQIAIPWGAATDKPVPADYDGDGKTDVAVFRPIDGSAQGYWYVLKSSDNFNQATFIAKQWGASTDKPVPADYNGDGKADFAVIRADDPSAGAVTWYISYSGSASFAAGPWGLNSDVAVVGDYDGDRKADLAVFRPSNGTWYVAKSTGGIIGGQWGLSDDVLVPADYDGDGKTDLAVFRPSDNAWYILGSTAGFISRSFGGSGETPVPSAYIP